MRKKEWRDTLVMKVTWNLQGEYRLDDSQKLGGGRRTLDTDSLSAQCMVEIVPFEYRFCTTVTNSGKTKREFVLMHFLDDSSSFNS